MTTTKFNVGLGGDDKISSKMDSMEDSSILNLNGYQKPHHRVLKPPGGETHDIFGTHSNFDNGMPKRQQLPHHQRNMQSNVFDSQPMVTSSVVNGSEEEVVVVAAATNNTPRAKNGNANSASRIFGGDDEVDEEQQQQVPRKVKDYLKSNIFGDDSQAFNNGNVIVATPQRRTNSHAYGGGNPITGEGYLNGGGTGEVKENGNVVATPIRVRNPPGGHSTKLW